MSGGHHTSSGDDPAGRRGAASGPEAPRAGVRVADGVIELDTLLGGWERVTAGYLIEGESPVLVETGSQSSVPVLLAQLEQLGLGARDLAGVVVTHIHLDHAGGVGDVARAFPDATIYVHEKGARHLADPTRLVDSASRVVRPPARLALRTARSDPRRADPRTRRSRGDTGERQPVARLGGLARTRQAPSGAARHVERCVVRRRCRGGEAARRRCTAPIDAPTRFRPRSGSPFAAPVRRAATDPLALAHYGVLDDPLDVLDEADGTLRSWVSIAESAYHRGEDIAAALDTAFASDLDGVDDAYREKLDVMNGVHSNAAGLHRWLSVRGRGGGPTPEES